MESILSAIASKIMSNHQLQVMVFGLIVKVVVDQLKKMATQLDADGNKTYKVPVELLVTVCSALAGFGDLYMQGHLGTFDATSVYNFIMVTLPIQLNAMGIHLFWSNVKEKTAK